MNTGIHVIGILLQIFTILRETRAGTLSPSIHSTDPHYRFHYFTGDYKTQEKYLNSDGIPEPNADSRIINFTADTSATFKADVKLQSAPTAIKLAPYATTTTAAFGNLYNYYRSGLAAQNKNHKPLRGLNPIVVKSLMPPARLASLPTPPIDNSQPYAFYKETKNTSSILQTMDSSETVAKSRQMNTTLTNTTISEKSSQSQEMKSISATTAGTITVTPMVNPEYKNHNIKSLLEEQMKPVTTRNMSVRQPLVPPSSGVNQLHKMDIPSSIMEILNQNKGQVYADPATMSMISSSGMFSDLATLKTGAAILETPTSNRTSHDIPQRPMRLIGLNPMYVDSMQLQTMTENLTSMPQFHLEPFANVQYAAPIPFYQGPLPLGPVGPFRNVPRSVNEPNGDTSLMNTSPLLNSISPYISQPGDIKTDQKTENKPMQPMQAPFLLCNDCLMPSNYLTYPVIRLPQSGPATGTIPLMTPVAAPPLAPPSAPAPTQSLPTVLSSQNSNNNQKSPCPSQAAAPIPLWASYPPSLAYILVPPQMIKNKINDTRPLPTNLFS